MTTTLINRWHCSCTHWHHISSHHGVKKIPSVLASRRAQDILFVLNVLLTGSHVIF